MIALGLLTGVGWADEPVTAEVVEVKVENGLRVLQGRRPPAVRFDRIDVLAEDPGTWWLDDLPRAGWNGGTVALKGLAQVKVVVALGGDGLQLGISASSQSLVLERPIWPSADLYAWGGLQTALLLPRGLMAGISYRPGPVRISVGVSAVSSASWARPDWSSFALLPTIGLGFGPVSRWRAGGRRRAAPPEDPR